jgi:histidyl-tRNA synthetase
VGIEAIGSEDPALDAEVIALADEGFRALGLTQFTLHLTSLGCATCRAPYRELLQNFLAKLNLDEATMQRAAINPLRVLDDKREEVQKQLVDAPLQVNHLCDDCKDHYDRVRTYLKLQGVTWSEAPRLVRGLDYYTRTTFEFEHHLLGAQSGIGGGGRYDGLMAQLGGQALSGIGFGLGTDRTLLACKAEGLTIADLSRCDVYLIALGEPAKEFVVKLSADLRANEIRSDMSYGDRGLKGSMKAADKSGARFTIVIGDEDLENQQCTIKNMITGEQTTSALSEIATTITTLK